jgi:hypothetical protein
VKLKMTGKPYTPNVAHNIKSWNAIVKCFEERGPIVSHLVLMGVIKGHPTPTTNTTKNAELHIKWHVEKMGTLEEIKNVSV